MFLPYILKVNVANLNCFEILVMAPVGGIRAPLGTCSSFINITLKYLHLRSRKIRFGSYLRNWRRHVWDHVCADMVRVNWTFVTGINRVGIALSEFREAIRTIWQTRTTRWFSSNRFSVTRLTIKLFWFTILVNNKRHTLFVLIFFDFFFLASFSAFLYAKSRRSFNFFAYSIIEVEDSTSGVNPRKAYAYASKCVRACQ